VIDLGDDMEFGLLPAGASRDTLQCSDPTIPSDDSNLVIKVRWPALVLAFVLAALAALAFLLAAAPRCSTPQQRRRCCSGRQVGGAPPALAALGWPTAEALPTAPLPPPVPPPPLLLQALNLYRRKTGSSSFFSVKLNKKVPHGGWVGWLGWVEGAGLPPPPLLPPAPAASQML
jgi:hypothetical protein